MMNDTLEERFNAIQDIVENIVFDRTDAYCSNAVRHDNMAMFIHEMERTKYCVEQCVKEVYKHNVHRAIKEAKDEG